MRNNVSHAPYIAENEVRFTSSRSSGPGGQNVNKVETKVRLHFDIFGSNKLSSEQKYILSQDKQISRYLDRNSGEIIIASQKFRSQGRNKEDALSILNALIIEALKPKIKRIKTKKPRSLNRKRLQDKKIIGERKKMRKVRNEY